MRRNHTIGAFAANRLCPEWFGRTGPDAPIAGMNAVGLRLKSQFPILTLLAAILLMAAGSPSALAQGRLDARYTVTLAGIKLGDGSWQVDVRDDRFSATASGSSAGLARMFSSGTGTTRSRGAVRNNRFVPDDYRVSLKWGRRKSEDLRMKMDGGHVKDVSIEPPRPDHPNRVKVTDAHRRNVLDPMTGSLLRVPGKGDLMAPQVCEQQTPVFDGQMRYDLKMAYKRIEQVKVEGYSGPALVCALYFAPLAGHIPDRKGVKYLVEQRDMETWLIPLAGTRVMIPFRVVVPTPLGQGILQATALNMSPVPSRASLQAD